MLQPYGALMVSLGGVRRARTWAGWRLKENVRKYNPCCVFMANAREMDAQVLNWLRGTER